MNKYVSPEIEIQMLQSDEVIMASEEAAITYGTLEGVDDENSKSAIFNVSFWLKN